MVSIGIVGDYQATNETHLATTASIGHSAEAAGLMIDVSWVPTAAVASDQEAALNGFQALLIAPGSPYESMDGALEAIRVARTRGVPLLGTCGGFQHVVLEFARNVLGVVDADHAEYDPSASNLFITPLSCSLAGQQMDVELRPGTLAATTYGSLTATERYYCNFGLNPERLPALVSGGLVVSGEDHNGEVRIMELPGHRFFVATLFVPQASSTADRPHPLVSAFVRAAADTNATALLRTT